MLSESMESPGWTLGPEAPRNTPMIIGLSWGQSGDLNGTFMGLWKILEHFAKLHDFLYASNAKSQTITVTSAGLTPESELGSQSFTSPLIAAILLPHLVVCFQPFSKCCFR